MKTTVYFAKVSLSNFSLAEEIPDLTQLIMMHNE